MKTVIDTIQEYSKAVPVPLLGVLALAVVMMAFGWVGYYGSDDMSYAEGALGWLNDFPYVGDSHWTLRHTVVVPIAIAFGIGGVGEFTLVLGTMLYHFALITAVYVVVARHLNTKTAVLTTLLIATLPLMVTQSTVVVPDFAEVFFCFVSLALFYEATLSDTPIKYLVLAGIAAGFSWLTRETVVFFLLTYGILFLAGFGIQRRLYFIMAGAFLCVVGTEFAYFVMTEGNALHRIFVDLSTHLRIDVSGGVGTLSEGMTGSLMKTEAHYYGVLTRTGSLSINRLIDPFLVVLANQEFMFLYLLAVPCVIWLAASPQGSASQQRFLRVFGLAGLVWFACIWLQIGMTLLPRYYMLPTIMLIIVFSFWLSEVIWDRKPLIAMLILAFIIPTNLMGTYIDNRNPIYAERVLTGFLTESDEVVHTDPETARRGDFLYKAAGVQDRVRAGEPVTGALFFFNPKYVILGQKIGVGTGTRAERLQRLEVYHPQEDWELVWTQTEKRRLLGRFLEFLGVDRLLPDEVVRRLNTPNPAVSLYRS